MNEVHMQFMAYLHQLANEYGKLDSDNIRQCYLLISKPENHPQPLKLSADTPVLDYSPDLSAYDELTGGAEL